jgi:uncharacterized protein
MDVLTILERHLGAETLLYDIVYTHSKHVMRKALQLVEKHKELCLNESFILEASLLHDIGVVKTYAPEIQCFGEAPYICHGYLGRAILEMEGLPKHALVCERHTGTGLYLTEIVERKLPLPMRDLAPISLEEQLICFADKFFTKSHLNEELSLDEVRVKLSKYGVNGLERFEKWAKMFL